MVIGLLAVWVDRTQPMLGWRARYRMARIGAFSMRGVRRHEKLLPTSPDVLCAKSSFIKDWVGFWLCVAVDLPLGVIFLGPLGRSAGEYRNAVVGGGLAASFSRLF